MMAMKALMRRTLGAPKAPLLRMMSTQQGKSVNMIQQMKEYQEALQFAVDKKFPESLEKLQDSIKVVE